jgi:hypothetical protein
MRASSGCVEVRGAWRHHEVVEGEQARRDDHFDVLLALRELKVREEEVPAEEQVLDAYTDAWLGLAQAKQRETGADHRRQHEVLVRSDHGMCLLDEPFDDRLAAQAMMVGRKLEQHAVVPVLVEGLAALAKAEAPGDEV